MVFLGSLESGCSAVGFVEYYDKFFSCMGEWERLSFCSAIVIYHPQDDGCLVQGLEAPFDAHDSMVSGVAYSGCVDETERCLAVDGIFYGIAGSSVYVGNNGFFFV